LLDNKDAPGYCHLLRIWQSLLSFELIFDVEEEVFLQRNLRSYLGLFWGGEGSLFQLQRMKRAMMILRVRGRFFGHVS